MSCDAQIKREPTNTVMITNSRISSDVGSSPFGSPSSKAFFSIPCSYIFRAERCRRVRHSRRRERRVRSERAQVVAFDGDEGANGSVRYSARARGPARGLLRVHAASGRLYAAPRLALQPPRSYDVTVRSCPLLYLAIL